VEPSCCGSKVAPSRGGNRNRFHQAEATILGPNFSPQTTMRLLHTADWHLGSTLGQANLPRAAEHAAFLDWLAETLHAQRVDVLLVAGDIFDQTQPRADAQEMYFRFLAKATAIAGLRRIIVVGGNHDSASRLDAPDGVLKALGITVVGGYSRAADDSRYLVPITADDGSVPLVVVALPYVHAWRLAVDDQSDPDALERAFRGLYSDLADAATARWPEAALVATGHLTCARERSLVTGHTIDGDRVGTLDSPQEIHMVGTLGALPPTVFDERYRYVALGHIHRGYPVDNGRVWYSGTPVAVNFAEGASSRKVLLVDLDGDSSPVVQPLAVPAARRVVELRGDEAAIRAAVLSLPMDGELPPLVSMVVEGSTPVLGQRDALRDLLESRFPEAASRPVIVSWRDVRPTESDLATDVVRTPLERPSPETVFRQAWIARHGAAPDEEIMAGFSSLLSAERT